MQYSSIFNRIKANPDDSIEEKEVTLREDDFTVETITLDNGAVLIIIKCPAPQKPPEAGYIGILTTDIPRYFISEYETNEKTKLLYPEKEWGPKYFLCEWVQKDIKDYGEVAETKEAFVEGIKKLLSN